jgi:hypothetical protein
MLKLNAHMGNFFKGVVSDSASILEGRYLSFAVLNISSALFNFRRGLKILYNVGFHKGLLLLTMIDAFCYDFVVTFLHKRIGNRLMYMLTWPCGFLTNFRYIRNHARWAKIYILSKGTFYKSVLRRVHKD